jgi:hypothetical protein
MSTTTTTTTSTFPKIDLSQVGKSFTSKRRRRKPLSSPLNHKRK